MNLELKKFDMKNISFKTDENAGPVIVFIGRRDTGKRFLVRDLLYYHQDTLAVFFFHICLRLLCIWFLSPFDY